MSGKKGTTPAKEKRKRKIFLLIAEVFVILILAVLLFVTSKLSKIEKNRIDADNVSINEDISDESLSLMSKYTTIALFGLDNRSNGSLSR